ncbi:uncharacterized protein LOC109957941 [Tachysurus ichikawai]
MAPVKRHAYEAQFKLQAISYVVVNGNRAAAKEFNINESMVRKWRKQENELCQLKKTKQSFRRNKARWPQLEDQLEQWINEQRTARRSVSTVTIRLKATKIAQDMKIEHFQGGPSWCFHFMKRRHLSIRARTNMAQQLPADYKEKLPIFRTYCSNKITHKKIQPNHITNIDEVPLTFDIPLNHTVVRAFAKAGIIAEHPPGNETDSDNDEREPGMFDGEIAQLFSSDTEDENFDGFMRED